MRNVLTILVVSMLFAGCCTFRPDGGFCKKGFASGACGGPVTGYTGTVVAYGESSMVVVPISHIRENTEWRFILRPIGNSATLENATVTITGKVPPAPGDNAWINTAGPGATIISGSYNGAANHMLTACVKPPVPDEASYYYIVDIDGVGVLDPRADID